jgi:hypothetical protein
MPIVGTTEILVILLVMLFVSVVASVLTVLTFWKICSKAGFPGALSLLMLVPVANVILLFYIAFAEWPALPDRH